MKKVNIQLEDEDHIKVKLISVLKGMTMNEFFEKAIKEALEKDSKLLDKIPRLDKGREKK